MLTKIKLSISLKLPELTLILVNIQLPSDSLNLLNLSVRKIVSSFLIFCWERHYIALSSIEMMKPKVT